MADVQAPLPVLIASQLQDAVVEPPTSAEADTTDPTVPERIESVSRTMPDSPEDPPAPVGDSVEEDEKSAEDEDIPFVPELFPFHTEVYSTARSMCLFLC